MFKFIALVGLMAVLGGCVIAAPPQPNDPSYAPVIMPSSAIAQPANGSLFSQTHAMDLYGDGTAKRVGDIITVVLDENTVSQKSSNVGVKKDSNISIPEAAGAAGTVLGRGVGALGYSLGTDLTGQRDFTGEADAAQRNNLQGNIAVTVVDVWPNGALVIRGEKWMTLNRGDEFIRITGVIRPQDIQQDNTVLSNKVANARITYSGTGALADSQSMGWLNRFFNSAYWPF